ncbi:MAG: LysM peptidoglycan-binding domain-containing protein [Anaerolineaceae bacterium]|nr:LysM peptidoglycan-binding domain-containing protein [Anaerolineaceae bacterium]
MRLRRFIRNIFILLLVVAIFASVAYYIYIGDRKQRTTIMYDMITQAVSTAIQDALYNATRTAEADEPHYITLKVGSTDSLLAIAEQYDTTIDVLRMANNLLPNVDFGDGSEIIITRGVKQLTPPRRFKKPYIAQRGDDLASIASRNGVNLEILAMDNPTLAKRGVNPGDLVFIAELL